MSEIRSTDTHGQLIVAHDTRASVWTAETTADTAEQVPGRVVPGRDTRLRLVASGDQDGTDTIELQTLRAGSAGTRCEIGWKKSTDAHVYGYDQPTIPTHVECVYHTTDNATSARLANPRAVVLDDDRILLSWSQYAPAFTATTPPNYFYAVRSAAGVWRWRGADVPRMRWPVRCAPCTTRHGGICSALYGDARKPGRGTDGTGRSCAKHTSGAGP